MATKPLPSWIDTLFNLIPDKSITIRRTINGDLSFTIRKQLNRNWSKSLELVFTEEDIRQYGNPTL